jgi:hypothetical protein
VRLPHATSLSVHRRVLLGSRARRITRSRLILAACEREVGRARPVRGLVRLLAQGAAERWVRAPASFRAAGDRARVVVCQVRLRADGTGRGGFAEGSWVAKELAAAALRRIAERDVLANVALAVEQKHLGQLGAADKGDHHGGGGLFLSVLGGGKPSGRLSQLRSWIQHLDLFASVVGRGGGGDPVYHVAGPTTSQLRPREKQKQCTKPQNKNFLQITSLRQPRCPQPAMPFRSFFLSLPPSP